MSAGDCPGLQVYRDARVRLRIGDSILAVTPVQGVRAGVALQEVRAVAALHGIVAGAAPKNIVSGFSLNAVVAAIATQHVHIFTADDVLKTLYAVPRRISSKCLTSKQVHCNALD